MSARKCVMYGCGLTAGDTPKRRLYSFPVHDRIRCQKWVDACGNDVIKKKWEKGTLTRDNRVCGDHFPTYSRNVKLLPHNAVPVSIFTCYCFVVAHDHFIGVDYKGCKRCTAPDLKVKKDSVVNKKMASTLSHNTISEKICKKIGKKTEMDSVVNADSIKEEPYDLSEEICELSHMRNISNKQPVSRCGVIHSKAPTLTPRKRNFRIFTDSAVARWTTVPSSLRKRYLMHLSKFQDIDTNLKVNELTKTVNNTMEPAYKDSSEESEAEIWDLYSFDDDASTSLTTKSSWNVFQKEGLSMPDSVLFDHINNSKIGKGPSATKGTAPCPKPTSSISVDKPTNPNDPSFLRKILSVNKTRSVKKSEHFQAVKPEQSVYYMKTGLKVTGLGKNINASSSIDPSTQANLNLTPRHEYSDFDFTNSRMIYWTYDCGNGVVETVVECISQMERNRVVRVPAKEVIQQLQTANRRQGLSIEKKKGREKKSSNEYVKQIRRLKYRIAQLRKELDAPKAYEKFLNDDQIEAMDKETTQGHHWKDDTIVLAHNIRMACTTKGYKYLYRQLNWPLPSIKTLQKRAKELHLPCPHVIRAVIVKKPGEKKATQIKTEKSETDLAVETIDDEQYIKAELDGRFDTDEDSEDDENPTIIESSQIQSGSSEEGVTVKLDDFTQLFFTNTNQNDRPKKVILEGVKKSRKRCSRDVMKEAMCNGNSKSKKKKVPNVNIASNENIFTQFVHENENEIVYLNYEDVKEEPSIPDTQYVLDDQLRTLADVSVIDKVPENVLAGKNIVVQKLLPAGNFRNFDDQFQRLLGLNSYSTFEDT